MKVVIMINNDKIIQIIPCVKPVIAVYEPVDEEGEYSFSYIYYIGLKEDGSIIAIDIIDGYFDGTDEVQNFVGIWNNAEQAENEKFYGQMRKFEEEYKP